MNKDGKFIVITGLDGSGTTSIAKKLAERDPNGIFIHTPNNIFSKYRNEFDSELRINSPVSHYHFYLSAVISASDEIKKILKSKNVYCVRYLIDTVVSHRVMGINVNLDYDLGYYKIEKPNLTLFIHVDEKIRQQRITYRGKSELDKILDKISIRTKFIKEFVRLSDEYKVINNSGEIYDTIKQAETYINQLWFYPLTFKLIS